LLQILPVELAFDELSKSSIVFYGHDNEENRYFKSANENFIGQPDYIFKNDTTNDIFVVEEKFQFLPKDPSTFDYSYYSDEEEQKIIKKRASKTFFSNHVNQLNSYIYGIGEYDIRYGYLVYWKYELEDGNPNIVACNVLRIDTLSRVPISFSNASFSFRFLISSTICGNSLSLISCENIYKIAI
jgi:hypothetical protein